MKYHLTDEGLVDVHDWWMNRAPLAAPGIPPFRWRQDDAPWLRREYLADRIQRGLQEGSRLSIGAARAFRFYWEGMNPDS